MAASPTPTSLTDRAIAPDLARGVMLLLIAVANAPWYLWASETRMLSAHPVEASVLDRVVQTISLVAVDGRTYPMFAFLFGYGIWQLSSRQLAAGADRRAARRLLRRRHLWMIAFGAVHAALLWMGDIVGAYGLAGLVLVWIFLDRRDRTLKVWAIVLAGLLALWAVLGVIGGAFASLADPAALEAASVELDDRAPISESSYPMSVVLRLGFWLLITPVQGLVGLAVPTAILLAILAARHRVLEEPERHLPRLRRTAVLGISIGWVVGAVVALQNLGLLGLPAFLDWALLGPQTISGLACGIGYVAVFGLIAERMRRRGSPGPVAGALQAVGKRSLSFYLWQSLVFAPVMSAWGLGLGARLGSASIALWAVAVWAVGVTIAVLLERRGVRGPAEWLLRRLAYRRAPIRRQDAAPQ